jgi:hypothetical protein
MQLAQHVHDAAVQHDNMQKEHMSECELQVSSFNGANEINNPWKENIFMIVGMPPKIWAS